MEKVGLERSLQLLERNSLEIDTLITDRHLSINKMIRIDHPSICHLFDIWHVAKGMEHIRIL